MKIHAAASGKGLILLVSTLVVFIIIEFGSVVFAGTVASKPDVITIGPPMRVVVVKAAGCADKCPEWISAEGSIYPSTAATFRKVIAKLGKRKLPVFISSNGGNVTAAMQIGRLLRLHHLDVAVTWTRFDGCKPTDKSCSPSAGAEQFRGTPHSLGAVCASACPILLSGGEQRLISVGTSIGVHEVRDFSLLPEYKVKIEPLTATGKRYIDNLKSELVDYFKGNGISEHIVKLMFSTEIHEMHWLTRPELAELNLMTRPIGGEFLIASALPPVVAEQAFRFRSIPIADDFVADIAVDGTVGGTDVRWLAIIRKTSAMRPPPHRSLRIEFADGRIASASTSLADPPSSDVIRGTMPLRDYCDIEVGTPVRLRLTAWTATVGTTRESIGDRQRLPAPVAPLPDCKSLKTATAVLPPVLEAKGATPDSVVEKILRRQSLQPNVAIAEAYFMDMRFERYEGSDDVTWSAIVRENQQLLPKSQVSVRLEFPDGHVASAGALIPDTSKPVSVEGAMSLQDYCALARGAAMRIHLTATLPTLRSPRDFTGERRAMSAPQPIWPDCGPVASAVTPPAPVLSGVPARVDHARTP